MPEKCSHTLFLAKSNCSLMGLSNEVLYILADERAAKQPEAKVGDTKKIRDSNPGRNRAVQSRLSGRIFFQISNFDIWQFCSLLSYKDA